MIGPGLLYSTAARPRPGALRIGAGHVRIHPYGPWLGPVSGGRRTVLPDRVAVESTAARGFAGEPGAEAIRPAEDRVQGDDVMAGRPCSDYGNLSLTPPQHPSAANRPLAVSQKEPPTTFGASCSGAAWARQSTAHTATDTRRRPTAPLCKFLSWRTISTRASSVGEK